MAGTGCRVDEIDNDLVVATHTGTHVEASNLRWYMEKVSKRLSLPKLSLHGIYHTHAALLLADHEPLNAVAERLVHNAPALTARTYAHVLSSTEKELAKTMGKHLQVKTKQLRDGGKIGGNIKF